MATKQTTVVVTGATGNQGGGVIKALLEQPESFHVRAVTRNPDSNQAKKLTEQDVDVVKGDLSDHSSLVQAFTGADGLFLVTDFYGGAAGNAHTELQHGKNAINAAKEAGVKFVVFSTLEHIPDDVRKALPVIEDGMVIPHFESKAAVEDYLRQSGLPFGLLLTCMFYENVINFAAYMKSEDGYTFGDNLVLFKDPSKYEGQTVPVVGERISNPDIARHISEATGKTVKYNAMSDEQFAALPFPAAKELANMYRYYREFPYYDQLRPLDMRVYVGAPFKDWAQQHKDEVVNKLEATQ